MKTSSATDSRTRDAFKTTEKLHYNVGSGSASGNGGQNYYIPVPHYVVTGCYEVFLKHELWFEKLDRGTTSLNSWRIV